MKFEFSFKRGGSVIVTTIAQAPKTALALKVEAPLELDRAAGPMVGP